MIVFFYYIIKSNKIEVKISTFYKTYSPSTSTTCSKRLDKALLGSQITRWGNYFHSLVNLFYRAFKLDSREPTTRVTFVTTAKHSPSVCSKLLMMRLIVARIILIF